jgi:hypothetical protein
MLFSKQLIFLKKKTLTSSALIRHVSNLFELFLNIVDFPGNVVRANLEELVQKVLIF